MKINVKVWAVSLLVVAALLMTGAICLLRYTILAEQPRQSGWQVKKGYTCYLGDNGKPLLGWQEIDGDTYYFLADIGAMATGWKNIGGRNYYLGQDGKRVTGFQEIKGERYYFGTDGKMVTGWQEVDGARYYFDKKGISLTGWQTIEDRRYYLSPEGKTLTGWQTVEDKLYYFAEAGHTVSGWQELDGVLHCLGEDGTFLSGWFEDETGKYYLDEQGKPKLGWQEIEDKRYYFDENGVMATDWRTLGEDRYYFGTDGSMSVGEVKIGGVSNFFTSKGKYVLLCNRDNPVPEDFELDLVSTGSYQIDRSAKDSLEAMIKACRNAGYSCTINNTYRSKDTQQYLWDKSVNKYMAQGMSYEKACEETGKDTMIPGHSEHQTGLAVDLDGSKSGYDWLAEHCWEYGFILRYPADSVELTGIIHEPWHFRYVGTELSLELQELGLCMEAYMQNLTK